VKKTGRTPPLLMFSYSKDYPYRARVEIMRLRALVKKLRRQLRAAQPRTLIGRDFRRGGRVVNLYGKLKKARPRHAIYSAGPPCVWNVGSRAGRPAHKCGARSIDSQLSSKPLCPRHLRIERAKKAAEATTTKGSAR
jgi:hypothetical protein